MRNEVLDLANVGLDPVMHPERKGFNPEWITSPFSQNALGSLMRCLRWSSRSTVMLPRCFIYDHSHRIFWVKVGRCVLCLSPHSNHTHTHTCSQLLAHNKNMHKPQFFVILADHFCHYQTCILLCFWPLSNLAHLLIYCVSMTGIFNLVRKGPVCLQAFIPDK